jgi:hypothetical protein
MLPEEINEFEKKVQRSTEDLNEEIRLCLIRNEVP